MLRTGTRLFSDLESFLVAVRDSVATTGAVPASTDEGTLADPFDPCVTPRIDYRPSSDLRDGDGGPCQLDIGQGADAR